MRNYEPAKPFSLNCRKCQNEFDFEEVLEDCVTEELESVIHTAVMDGADLPCTDCPECQRSTYIFDEECCLVCGYSYNYKSCSICATQLDIEEAYNGDLCSYHRWVIEKADD